jgi:hypothetical protein
MLKHEPGMVEDDSYMAIPRLVETEPFPGCFPKDTPTSGWSHKTSKNPTLILLVIRRDRRVETWNPLEEGADVDASVAD